MTEQDREDAAKIEGVLREYVAGREVDAATAQTMAALAVSLRLADLTDAVRDKPPLRSDKWAANANHRSPMIEKARRIREDPDTYFAEARARARAEVDDEQR